MTVSILALDVASSTGWASHVDKSHPTLVPVSSGTQEFKLGRGESPGMRFLRFRKWLSEMIEMVKPEVIAFERPSFFRSQAAGECIHGLLAVMQAVAAEQGVETLPVQTAVLKKHATGKGNAKKPAMVAAARKRWGVELREEEHDRADALEVLSWALEQVGTPPAQGRVVIRPGRIV